MSVSDVETSDDELAESGRDGGGAPVSQTVAGQRVVSFLGLRLGGPRPAVAAPVAARAVASPASAPAAMLDLEAQALAAARGDRNAFKAIVDNTNRPLYALAYHLLGDSAGAKDAVQEAYLRAFVNLPRFEPRGTGTCLAWLRRITLNICRDWVRAKRPVLLPDEADLDAHSTGAWSEAAAVGETADPAEVLALEDEDLREAVRELPMKYREVVVLRYSHDLSYAEIARTLGEPENTVATHLRRALLMLRRSLVERGEHA